MYVQQFNIQTKNLKMQDPKYQKVRGELDRLKFLEHLGPESVDLVERLVKEYTKLFDSFMKLKKKTDNKNDPNQSNLQHQLDLLNENYSKTKQQNERLRKQLEQGGISEKIRMLESSLNSCRSKYEKELDQLRDKVSNSEFKIDQLTYTKNSLTEDNNRLRGKLQKNNCENQQQNQQLLALLERKKKEIAKLEEENSKNRIQISSLERLYQQQKQNWANLESQTNKQSSGALQIIKKQLEQVQQKLQLSRDQLSQERDRNKQLNEKIRNLTQQISNIRNNQDYAKSSYSIQANAKSKLQSMLKESQQKNNELREKVLIFEREKESDEQQIQKYSTKVKQLSNKNNNLKTNMDRLQQQLCVLNNNFTQKVRQLREAQNKRVTLQKRIKDLQFEMEQKNNDDKVINKMEDSRQQFEKKQTIYEKQIQISQTQLKVMQENQHKILMQKNKLEVDMKKLHLIIGQGNKQVEILREQKQALMKENKELKSMLNNTQSEEYTTKSQAMRLKQTIEEYQIIIEDLKVAIRNQQNSNKTHVHKVTELEKQVERKNAAHKKMFDDNKQLQMLVSSLEKTKGELFEKYKMSAEEKSVNDNISLEQRKQYSMLVDQRKQLLEKLRSKEMSIASLNAEYDQLQNQLDNVTEENYQLKREMEKLQRERDNIDKGLGERQANIQGMSMKINSLENEIQKYERIYHSKCSDFQDACVEINKRKLQVQEYKNQINILVLNNKELQKTAERIRINSIDLERKLKDRIGEIDQYREVAGAAKIQNQNLRDEVRKEKEALHVLNNKFEELVDQYNNVYNTLIDRDRQLEEYKQACMQFRMNEEAHRNQIHQLEKQLRSVGEDLARKDEQIMGLRNQKEYYRAEVGSSRRSFNNTNNDKFFYEQKIRDLERDYQVKVKQCESLKNRLRRTQMIVEEEREKCYYLQDQLKKSKLEGSQTPIKKFYKSQVESENWNSYNRDVSDSENSECMDVGRKFYRNSRAVGESFESERASYASKQCNQRLLEIAKQYEQV